MHKLFAYLKRPYEQKGFIIGTVDTCLKAVTLFVWGYLTVVLCALFFNSMMLDYNPMNKM